MTIEQCVDVLTKLRRDVVHVVAWMVRWQQRTNDDMATPDLETILGTGEAVDIFISVYICVLAFSAIRTSSSTTRMFCSDVPRWRGQLWPMPLERDS